MGMDCLAVAYISNNGIIESEILVDIGFKTYHDEIGSGYSKPFDLETAVARISEQYKTKNFILFTQNLDMPNFNIVEDGVEVETATTDSYGSVSNGYLISNGWVVNYNGYSLCNHDIYKDIFVVIDKKIDNDLSVNFLNTENEAIEKARQIANSEFAKNYQTEIDNTTINGNNFCYKIWTDSEIVMVFKSSEITSEILSKTDNLFNL